MVDLDAAVVALRDGSESAFVEVYRAVHPGLLRYLSTMVGDEADDVAQETWAHVCHDLHQFRGDGSAFRGWITTIGRNRALDHLRAHRRRPVDPVPAEDFAHVADPQDTAAQAVDAVSTQSAIALIASLPPDQAEAVLLLCANTSALNLVPPINGRVLTDRCRHCDGEPFSLRACRTARCLSPRRVPPTCDGPAIRAVVRRATARLEGSAHDDSSPWHFLLGQQSGPVASEPRMPA